MTRIALGLSEINPWTNVYGFARSLLALGTFLTLAFNDVDILFRPITTDSERILGIGLSTYSIFYLLEDNLPLAQIISLCILIVIISGWRPRFTGILHWWISFSFASSCAIIDGGDQITSILTLLLIPVCLLDERRSHWLAGSSVPDTKHKVFQLVAVSALIVVRIQMALLYLNAGVEKLAVSEWKNGTALYYWLDNTTIGLTPALKNLVLPLMSNPFVVSFLTWGVIGLEILLFAAFFIQKKYWKHLLVIALVFHFGIVIVHGLVSFFFAMSAGLILYLRPVNKAFKFQLANSLFHHRWLMLRRTLTKNHS
ncbi:MAG TPA: sporulation-delaying protein SdpB family protein [Chryseosolibacter sp.]|nr:sporulation-delaying protein SdpB family protein [Chryseosolibacter sp.]